MPTTSNQEETANKISRQPSTFDEYQMLLSSLNVSVSKHLLHSDFPVIWANDRFYTLTGHTREEFHSKYGRSCAAYFSGSQEDFDALRSTILRAYDAGEKGYTATLQVPHKNGSKLWVSLVGTFTDEIVEDRPVIYTVLTDVTSLVKAEREQDITTNSLPGFLVRVCVKADGIHFLSGNSQFFAYMGNWKTDETAASLRTYNLEQNNEILQQYLPQMMEGSPVCFDIRALSIQGMELFFQVYGDCVERQSDGNVYLFTFVDSTEITMQKLQLEELAFVDPVTGGKNRTRFEMDVSMSIIGAEAEKFALVSLDIQKFKVINDLFGVEAGDKVLRHVFNCLESQLLEGECLARISADTFNLFLHYGTRESVAKRIFTFAEKINEFNLTAVQKYVLMLSAGVYPIDDSSMSITQMQDRATVARKQGSDIASSAYCNCRFYSNQDRLKLAAEKDIENRMHSALTNGEFCIYLQPKQSIRTGKTCGAEALVRWNDPEAGLIPPGKFIPLFEKNGFIVELDRFVFEEVCKLIKSWIDRGLTPVPISVNMSRCHLHYPDFWTAYEKIRKSYNIPQELLEIELTETMVFEDPEKLITVIDDIKNGGYQCSMDDFGSGYSSLNTLKSIRVDTLKLDKAFFPEDVDNDPRSIAIIKAVVQLAGELQMKTVAEGVEKQNQADFLKTTGCDTIQGYLFARPMPIKDFEHFVFKDE